MEFLIINYMVGWYKDTIYILFGFNTNFNYKTYMDYSTKGSSSIDWARYMSYYKLSSKIFDSYR